MGGWGEGQVITYQYTSYIKVHMYDDIHHTNEETVLVKIVMGAEASQFASETTATFLAVPVYTASAHEHN